MFSKGVFVLSGGPLRGGGSELCGASARISARIFSLSGSRFQLVGQKGSEKGALLVAIEEDFDPFFHALPDHFRNYTVTEMRVDDALPASELRERALLRLGPAAVS